MVDGPHAKEGSDSQSERVLLWRSWEPAALPGRLASSGGRLFPAVGRCATEDVVALLRREVDEGGGQVAWSKKKGVDRSTLGRVLKGYRPPSAAIIAALKLRMVCTPGIGIWSKTLPRQTLQQPHRQRKVPA